AKEGLQISEVMSSNSSYLPQNGYQFYDWIELFNNSEEAIALSDYCLTTAISDPDLYKLPEVTLGPGEYFIIMCSGKTALTNDSYHHANFKIGGSESIFLTKGGKVEDCVYTFDIPLGYSYSRGKQYGWVYTSKPTPGSANADGVRMISPSPVIETEAGIYNDVSSVEVKISGPGNIYYTTDGSDPTIYSARYTGPLRLRYTTVLKAVAMVGGAAVSLPVCSSYIINDPHRMPVVSVSLNPWEYNTLYTNFYDGLIYKANFELFEKDGSVSSPCGINISGKSGTIYTKKNYGLKFEGEYGAKSLDYKVFEDLDCSSFDSIVLRGGSNAEMSLPWKDEFASALADEYLLTRKFKTCALYINGDYKGIFNAREKITPTMIADNFNVDKSLVNISRWENTLEYGENVWREVKSWAASHNLASDENYYAFCRMVDVEELCDLWIFQMYMNNPDLYNIRVFSHPDIDDGRCKFIFFDLDLGFYGPNGNYLSTMTFNPSGYAEDLSGHSYDISVNLNLLRNENFRRLFLQRLSYHLHNSLSTENALATFDYFTDLYASEIERDLYSNGYSTEWYYSNINEFRWIITNRTWTLMSYAQSFFGLSSLEMSEIFGDLW
ncbi:MAG: CotH kinase family protein, partial [Firmicutes bacterium]|nr:CotH kinase family protein [Bacillota bacterium]